MSGLVVIPPDEAGVCRLTLARPERANAIDAELGDALLASLEAAAQSGCRVLILAAEGRNFSGGFDFSGYEEQSEGDLLLRFVRIEQALQTLRAAPFASIACTHGAAFGAGADLVAACTFRFGTANSRFRFPGYRFGVALGTRRLAEIAGTEAARDILISGRVLEAAEGEAVGLVQRMPDEPAMAAAVASLTRSLTALDGPSLAALLRNSRTGDDGADQCLAELVRSVARPGLKERIRQFRNENAAAGR